MPEKLIYDISLSDLERKRVTTVRFATCIDTARHQYIGQKYVYERRVSSKRVTLMHRIRRIDAGTQDASHPSCPGPEIFYETELGDEGCVRACPADTRTPVRPISVSFLGSSSASPLRYGPSPSHSSPLLSSPDLEEVGSYGGPAPGDDAAAASLPSRFPLGYFPPVAAALGFSVRCGRGATQSAAGAGVAGSMAAHARSTGSMEAHARSFGSMAVPPMAAESATQVV